MKFYKGDIVKLTGYTRRALTDDVKSEYGLKYFVECYTKEHDLASLVVNDFDVEYVVLPTGPMPVFSRLEDGKLVTYYPIQELHDSHSKKFFVADTYLTKVGNIYEEELEDEEPEDEEPEDEEEDLFDDPWDEDEELNKTPEKEENEDGEEKPSDDDEDDYVRCQEFLKISKNISTVIDSLQSILDSLTKIAKNEV